MSVVFRTALFVIFIHGMVLLGIPCLLLAWRGGFAAHLPSGLDLRNFVGLVSAMVGLWCYGGSVCGLISIGKGTPAIWDPPTRFVSKGLYERTRNPMYLGMILIVASESIFFRSAELIFYAAFLWGFFHLFVVYHEEPFLRKKFGTGYAEYFKTVPRWVPRFKK